MRELFKLRHDGSRFKGYAVEDRRLGSAVPFFVVVLGGEKGNNSEVQTQRDWQY